MSEEGVPSSSVEGIPPRDEVVVFSRHFASYNPGEFACFTIEEAQALIDLGVASPPPPTPAILTGGVVVNPAGLLLALQSQTMAAFAISVNGTVDQVGPLDLTDTISLSGVAVRFGVAMRDAGCTWDTDHFTITTDATGPSATLSYAAAPTIGADVSNICRITATTAASLTQGT